MTSEDASSSPPSSAHAPRALRVGIRDVVFGRDVVYVEPVNMYECTLGDGCFVGPFCEVQRGVVIGRKTRVQSHTFICSKVTIGEACFVGHGVSFVNDWCRDGEPCFDPDGWQPVTIGDRVMIGTNTTIMPVSICSDVTIGAGSVVTRDIVSPGIYAGVPARRMGGGGDGDRGTGGGGGGSGGGGGEGSELGGGEGGGEGGDLGLWRAPRLVLMGAVVAVVGTLCAYRRRVVVVS